MKKLYPNSHVEWPAMLLAAAVIGAGCRHEGIASRGMTRERPAPTATEFQVTQKMANLMIGTSLAEALLMPGESIARIATLRLNPVAPPTTLGNAEPLRKLAVSILTAGAENAAKAGDAAKAAELRQQVAQLESLLCVAGPGQICLDLTSLASENDPPITDAFGPSVRLDNLGGVNLCALKNGAAPLVDCKALFADVKKGVAGLNLMSAIPGAGPLVPKVNVGWDSEIDLDVEMFPTAGIERRIPNLGESEPSRGLVLDFRLVPHAAADSSLTVDGDCRCPGSQGAVCQQICGGIPSGLKSSGIVIGVHVTGTLEKVFWGLSFLPGPATGKSTGKPMWTRNLFKGSKGFDTGLFPVKASLFQRNVIGARSFDVDCGGALDIITHATCAVWAEAIGELATPKDVFSPITEGAATALRPLIDRLLNYDGRKFDAMSSPFTCDATNPACFSTLVTDVLPASLTYQKLDWFYAPFGPSGSLGTAYMPVKRAFVGPEYYDYESDVSQPPSYLGFELVPDSDGDGVPWSTDNCPNYFNWEQADADKDGRGDRCDPCPFDPGPAPYFGDDDGDGLCNGVDNCPKAPNPDQSNANELSETVHTPAFQWGDVCDPVPTPAFMAAPRVKATIGQRGTMGDAILTQHTIADALELTPLRSNAAPTKSGGPSAVDVSAIPTHFRYCAKPQMDTDRRCDDRDSIQDSQLLPAFGESRLTPYHAITVAPATTPFGVSGLAYPQNYVNATQAGASRTKFAWDFAADYARWLQNGLAPVDGLATITGPFVGGEAMDGMMWVHAETTAGSVDIGTGVHGDQVANVYQAWPVGAVTKLILPPYLTAPRVRLPVWIPDRGGDWRGGGPGGPDPTPWITPGHFTRPTPVGVVDDKIVAIEELSNVGVDVTAAFAPRLKANLLRSDVVWLTQAEPSLRTEVNPVFAIGVSADGRVIHDVAFNSQGVTMGLADLADAAIAPSRVPVTNANVVALASAGWIGDAVPAAPQSLRPFKGVFSRRTNKVFLIEEMPAGPVDIKGDASNMAAGKTNGPLGVVNSTLWVGAPGESLAAIEMGVSLGRVLATTYHPDLGIVILDDVDGHRRAARLLVVDPETGAVITISTWSVIGSFDAWYLVADRDDGVLISGTSASLNRHAIAHVDFGLGRVTQVVPQKGHLALAPVVDERGYQRITVDGATGELKATGSYALDPRDEWKHPPRPDKPELERRFLGKWRQWTKLERTDLLRGLF